MLKIIKTENIIFFFILFITLLIFNYIKFYPINLSEFSNPDFSVGLDKINNFNLIKDLPQSTFQYGPGYEFLYRIFAKFRFITVDNFYFSTRIVFPTISLFFLFLLISLNKFKFSKTLILATSLLMLEFFIYSSVRYVPIICLSLALINYDYKNNIVFYILIFLFGFFFFVGIDYGLIAYISIFLMSILKNNFNFFKLKSFYLSLLLLISIIINHFIFLGSFNFIATINELFIFSNFFDITDPSFSSQYPFFDFNFFNLTLRNFLKLVEHNIFVSIFYIFPFLQLLFILFILIQNLYKYKTFKNIPCDIIFLSAFVFATQIRMLFGPGFIVYNYLSVILLLILITEYFKIKFYHIIFISLSILFLLIFSYNTNKKFNSHLSNSIDTALEYPILDRGIYFDQLMLSDVTKVEDFFNDVNTTDILIYPWSYLSTFSGLNKINLTYDDRHFVSESSLQNEILNNFLDKTNDNPYLLVDLHYSLGIAFFNKNGGTLNNITDQYSNFTKNSLVFNGYKNPLREFISKNYKHIQSFGKFHIFKKEGSFDIPIDTYQTSYNFSKITPDFVDSKSYSILETDIKSLNLNDKYKVDLTDNPSPFHFIDLSLLFTQNNLIKKFFGQNFLYLEFYDSNNVLISTTSRAISRNHYNNVIKMRFFVSNPDKKYNVSKILFSFDKIKSYSFKPDEFDIKALDVGQINY